MINVIKVDDFEKFTAKLEEITTAIQNMPAPTGGDVDYSTEEQDTGVKWIDGKTIYQKTIYVPSVATGTASNIQHDIDNIETCVSITGTCIFQSTTRLPLPYISTSINYNICLGNVTHSNFMIQTGTSITISDAYVTIRYTKGV